MVGSFAARAISLDDTGNDYITGLFYKIDTCGTTKISSYGNNDMFIATYGNEGNYFWTKDRAGYFDVHGDRISSSSNSHLYIVGSDGCIANFLVLISNTVVEPHSSGRIMGVVSSHWVVIQL